MYTYICTYICAVRTARGQALACAVHTGHGDRHKHVQHTPGAEVDGSCKHMCSALGEGIGHYIYARHAPGMEAGINMRGAHPCGGGRVLVL